jgi:hypothetical protein
MASCVQGGVWPVGVGRVGVQELRRRLPVGLLKELIGDAAHASEEMVMNGYAALPSAAFGFKRPGNRLV